MCIFTLYLCIPAYCIHFVSAVVAVVFGQLNASFSTLWWPFAGVISVSLQILLTRSVDYVAHVVLEGP